ncbi:hypothetical protein VPNG_07515 [Cytospora leucostoma]|uniref:GED domain-containing protein n=1 Tax=Cytospora leucostoma TaxID=1230097 RepID=A0A423WS67_9PEZI|nr:hypothetical protein VPNG_07515 [Cytospora leucostoma]
MKTTTEVDVANGTAGSVPSEDKTSLQIVMADTTSLEELQTDEQRRVLDTVSQVRKCGLESVLSLPQIVVCGDQSAGKSSVLEALTEIPFPRNDNLCTRFATEISLRREPINSLTIRVIPDSNRPHDKQEAIKSYSESITDFKELPYIMENAMKVMGISETGSAFAKDTLSIEIQGPDRPQLTLVDIPGLIQTSTKGVSEADVAMVAEITNSYIEQPRTICLAVVSATNDAANQPILQRVRKFDPLGERTLGVITKPDRLSAGSGAEAKFLELARNEDVFFKLGWHVIKNRKFEETSFSIEERNLSERTFFKTSNFKSLPRENVGIDALRTKLSQLLFDHVKKELPKLQEDLEAALRSAQDELKVMGDSRSTAAECRAFLAHLSMECHDICKAGLNGHYENEHFKAGGDQDFALDSPSSIARIRAAIQFANIDFADDFRYRGHKYNIHITGSDDADSDVEEYADNSLFRLRGVPKRLSKKQTTKWVRKMLLRSRGTELVGNFNPHLIAELFWEQSEGWEKLAKAHVEKISRLCQNFVGDLLKQMAPQDLKDRIWSSLVLGVLKERRQAALDELAKIIEDSKEVPINYNHYYTDTVHLKRQDRIKRSLLQYVPQGSTMSTRNCSVGAHYPQVDVGEELDKVVRRWADNVTPDMEEFSIQEALDCLMAIYKVQQKTFIANVVTQVIERHIVRGLHDIFSPMVVVNMSDAKVESIVSEPPATKRQRVFLGDRIKKLEEGQDIFRGVLDP